MGPFIREGEQVSTLFDGDRLFLWSVWTLHMDAELGFDAILIINLFDTHKGIVGRPFGESACHHDLLDQLQFESAHRIEPIDEVIGFGALRSSAECRVD